MDAVVTMTIPRGIRNNNPGNIDWPAVPAFLMQQG
jgi:hypothetical protein